MESGTGIVATLIVLLAGIVPPFGAIAALVWAQWSGTPLEALGLARPGSWVWTIAAGIAIGVALKFFTKALLLPLLGAPSTNAAYAQLVGNPAALLQLVLVSVFVGGIGEEIFWRGFLFERLGKLLGEGLGPQIAIIVVTTVAFALAHFWDQGVPGIEQALVTGATFGTMFAVTGVLWPSIIAHAVYDLTAVALIYAGLEQTVAHLIFR